MNTIELYDTTLRDGSQREGVSFSVFDKLNIAQKLDELGVKYIEGGYPGSNPKDREFYDEVKNLRFENATIVAFGSTRRAGVKAEDDENLNALVASGVKAATIVGKCSAMHVTQVLETTLEENIAMAYDSIEYLKNNGMKVFFDAEHFFDGYRNDPEYALKVLKEAEKAGADALVLCDTNGGFLPDEISEIVKEVKKEIKTPLGIHAHNDNEVAVANTLAAVKAGATQVQGTINGFGERCGNANLCTIIPTLKLKMGEDVISDEQLSKLTDLSNYVSEMANLLPEPFLPYVGSSAFSHKAGLHVSGMRKWQNSYQHINPEVVGNRPRVLVSELAGKANIIERAKAIGVKLDAKGKEIKTLLERVKNFESRGFQYENAEASFDLMVHQADPDYKPPFELVDYMVIIENRRRMPTRSKAEEELLAEAMVKVRINGKIVHTVSEGNGPVNALDRALRKGLTKYYPALEQVKLVDYKVRIIGESISTDSVIRVLIESSDGVNSWRTVGSSDNVIAASWLALSDSMEYWLAKQEANNKG